MDTRTLSEIQEDDWRRLRPKLLQVAQDLADTADMLWNEHDQVASEEGVIAGSQKVMDISDVLTALCK